MYERIQVEETGNDLRIKVRWRSGYLMLLAVTLFAGVMCLSFGATAASSIGWISGSRESASAVAFFVNLILLILVCQSITAFWINFTVVDVSREYILVYSSPIPFPYPRRRTLPTSDVLQLFVERSFAASSGVGHGCGTGGAWRYDLCVSLIGGERISLLNVLGEEGENISRLIEQRVEEHLGIEDEYVEGEHLEDDCV